MGILGSFWRILDISKRILDRFSGKFPKNFRPHFGNYVAKPILVSFFPFLCLSATYAPRLRSPPKRKRTPCSLNHIKVFEKRLHWSFLECSLSVMIGWAGINRRNQKYYITPSLRKHPFLLALRRWWRFSRNLPSGEERGETDVFAGYITSSLFSYLAPFRRKFGRQLKKWV